MENHEEHQSIYNLNLEQIGVLLDTLHQPSYRRSQIWNGLYHHHYQSFDEFSNLPKNLRDILTKNISSSTITPAKFYRSDDGETEKILFSLHDNHAIETVLMRYRQRNTLCISTQVGCAVGCAFCATGKMGLKRNLTTGEIIEQVLYFSRKLQQENKSLTNIVFMGMGEPFHNYDSVRKSIDILNHPEGFNFGERRFTISTAGLIPSIIRFAKEKTQINLAVSLHAANDNLRSTLVPINKKYPLSELLKACHQYVDLTHRRITFEWALIKDVNDSLQDATELTSLCKNLLCHVNLIPLNPISDFKGQSVSIKWAKSFQNILMQKNIPCTIRLRRGIDIHAGCGQLATLNTMKE